MEENWRGVEAVAEELLRDGSLPSIDLSRILEEANCLRGEPVHEYELSKLGDRLGELGNQYKALLEEGHQEEARRVAAEYAQVKSKMENLARLYEGYDDQLHY